MLDYVAKYEEISSTAVSANPDVAVPLLTINGWILMQRRVPGGSKWFEQNWAAYVEGFGSAAGNDNYWLGLDKVYRLMQLGSVRLRVEVCNQNCHVNCEELLEGGSRALLPSYNIWVLAGAQGRRLNHYNGR